MQSKYYIFSTSEGCAVNLNESSTLCQMLNQEGLIRTDNSDEASIIIINTCAVNSKMAKKTSDYIQAIQQKYPDKKIITSGCYPAIQSSAYQKQFALPFVSPTNLSEIKTILKLGPSPALTTNDFSANKIDDQHLGATYHQHFKKIRSWLKNSGIKAFLPKKMRNLIDGIVYNPDFFILPLGSGCMGECSYCAIKYARGKAKSRPLDLIKQELANSPVKDIWLLSGDVGCWGQDIASTVVELFDEILTQTQFNFVINYFGPEWIEKYSEKLLSHVSRNNLAYIAIPMQSGSDEILKTANRYYQVETILHFIKKVRRNNPNLIIKTDYIIGLPGESWRDFWLSVKSSWAFDTVYAQSYTLHPKTPAEKAKNQVSKRQMKIRLNIFKLNILLRHSVTAISCLRFWT